MLVRIAVARGVLSSWDDLRVLEALDRLGSARAAGRELGVAPSTVYRRIAALEVALGVSCLDRRRGLTAPARELASLARTTHASLEGIVRKSRRARTEVRGTITLTTIDGFAPLLVAPLVELAARYPALSVDVQVSEAGGPSLRGREAEVGLTLVERPPASLVGRKVFAVKWAVYGTASLAADPDSARWVVLSAPHQTTWLGAWEAKHVPADRIAMSTPSRRLLVDLVAAGAGLGLLPRRLADGHPKLVEVAWHTASLPALTRPAWLLMHPDLRRDKRVLALTRTLAEHLRD